MIFLNSACVFLISWPVGLCHAETCAVGSAPLRQSPVLCMRTQAVLLISLTEVCADRWRGDMMMAAQQRRDRIGTNVGAS